MPATPQDASNRVRRPLTTSAAALLGTALLIGAAGTTAQAATDTSISSTRSSTGTQAKTSKTVTSTPGKTAGHAITLDGVALQVTTPDYPTGQLYTTPAGGLVQVASVSDNAPFRYLSITAAPYGQTLPASNYPISKAGNAAAWRAAQAATATTGPTATLFGQKITGQISHLQIPATTSGTAMRVEAVSWIVEAGARTWVVKLEHDANSLPESFGSGLNVSSINTDAKTTVNLGAAATAATAATTTTPTTTRTTTTTATSPTATRTGMMTTSAVALGGNLGRPSWWSSDCDGYSTLLNTKFMGLQVCGYTGTGGTWDRLESLPYGSVSQYEFECAELSQRYLVQRYQEYGPGGYGKSEADTWYNQYPSQFSDYANGSHTPPVPGDVVSFGVGSSGSGHTGVVIASNVNASGNGTIDMVHENWNQVPSTPGEWDGIQVSNWNVTDVTGQTGVVHWLHNPADTAVKPTLTISGGIVNGGVYRGSVSITVTATTTPDNSTVYLHVDGTTYTMSGSDTGYSLTLNTSTLTPGPHSVYAGAYFGGGTVTSPTDTITAEPTTSSSVVVAPNGHMYKFARGTDGTLHMWSAAPTTGWVDEGAQVFTQQIVGSPTAVIAPNGHMYVFAQGTDNWLHMWSSDFVTGWVDNGQQVVGGAVDGGSPSAVIAPNGHMYIFVQGTDSTLRMWSADFVTGWVDQGAQVFTQQIVGTPTPIIWGNGHMYIFAQGTDNWLHMWSSDFVTGWVDKGQQVYGGAVDGGSPSAVTWTNGHMYIFARGTDSTLRMWSADPVTGWADEGAQVFTQQITGDPNPMVWGNGHMYIFAQGPDNWLHMWSTQPTTGWVDQGGQVLGGAVDGGSPSAVTWTNGHMYIFARGTDNWLRMWSADPVTGWVDQGGQVLGGAVDAS